MINLHVRAVEAAGVVAALKHFPGHPRLEGNPAQGAATVLSNQTEIEAYLSGSREGIAAGARGVVLSSVAFPCFGGPANISAKVVHLLRQDLGFTGLVVTLDLDHPSCLGTSSLPEICLKALNAGADLLLLSPQGARDIPNIVGRIAHAVDTGALSLGRLTEAAAHVRRLAT